MKTVMNSGPMGRFVKMVGLVVVVGGLAACDGTTGPEGTSRVQVKLTDAPSDSIESAVVWISRVYLAAEETEEEEEPDERVDLFDDPDNPKEYDLLTLRDGITADLTDPVEVEEGVYGQLRLVVDSARITLAEVDTDDDGTPDTQLTFDNGETSKKLFVPSGAQSGIKVQLSRPIDAEAGETEIILVDFDVDRNFVIQSNPQTGVRDILFNPTLVEKSRTEEEEG